MYTYAHPIEDALENVTHSICTLEFEDQRPFYDWLLDTLCTLGLLAQPRPHQYEFARLNVTYVITSKRKLRQLVDERHRRRLGRPAHADDRRAAPARLHARVDPPHVRARRHQQGGRLDRLREPRDRAARRPRVEGAAGDGGARPDPPGAHQLGRDLRQRRAPRAVPCAGRIRSGPSSACATFSLGPELWIERDDFAEVPAKGFFRLYPGNRVRLKYGYVVECTGCEKDANGVVTRVLATIVADTRSGTPGADAVKVKGTLTWLAVDDALAGRGAPLRPAVQRAASRRRRQGLQGEPAIPTARRSSPDSSSARSATAQRGDRFQFERHGYFVADLVDHDPARPVFNRTATLRDTWSR